MRFDFLFYGLLLILCYNNAMAAACLNVVSNGSQNLVVYDPSANISTCALIGVSPSEWSELSGTVSTISTVFTEFSTRLGVVEVKISEMLQLDPTSLLNVADLSSSFAYGVLAILTLWFVGFGVGVVKKVLGKA